MENPLPKGPGALPLRLGSQVLHRIGQPAAAHWHVLSHPVYWVTVTHRTSTTDRSGSALWPRSRSTVRAILAAIKQDGPRPPRPASKRLMTVRAA